MLAFLYFVQMIINLPKMLVISWNNMLSIPSKSPENSIKINIINEKTPELWQTPDDVFRRHLTMNFSICHVAEYWNSEETNFSWKLSESTGIRQKMMENSKNCSQIFEIEFSNQENYEITLEITKNFKKIDIFTEKIQLKPMKNQFWLASIGDSFSSGQGNPDVPMTRGKPAKWLDESCYRSSKSFPYQVFQKLDQKPSVFSFFSCSGATVDNGILSKNGQLEKLENIVKIKKSPPDVLLLTIGGNDIGFTDVISLMERGISLENSFDMRFFFVSHQIDRVAAKINELKIPRVILMTYYDVTKNENGTTDASCGLFGQVSISNLQLAEKKVLRRLNNLLIKKAEKFGWITVDSSEIFKRNGLCSKDSVIRSQSESLKLQGNEYGSFHPNEDAHRMIADKILNVLRENR